MKVNLKSNIPDVSPTVTVVKLSDIKVGGACQIALGYKAGDKITQSEFNYLDKSYVKGIIDTKLRNEIKVILIDGETKCIGGVTDFEADTPVIPLDCEINFGVNYNIESKLDNKQ